MLASAVDHHVDVVTSVRHLPIGVRQRSKKALRVVARVHQKKTSKMLTLNWKKNGFGGWRWGVGAGGGGKLMNL